MYNKNKLSSKADKLIKLYKRYQELKCLEYTPFKYQLEMHQSTAPLVFLQCGNQQGKTRAAMQECAYWFRGYHPFKKLKKTTNLRIWLCSETHALAIESMYESKLKHILPTKEYKELREAGTLLGLEHKLTKNRIMFKSYAKGSSRLQSVPVDLVIIDEQPHWDEFDELRMRIRATRKQTGQSQLYLTFTPLKVDKLLRDFLLSDNTDIHKIKVTSYDCPLYTFEEIEKERKSLPERSFKIRHLGEWASYEGALIHSFNDSCIVSEKDIKPLPSWKSVLCVDPAPSGYTGISILSQHPITKKWYVVKEDMPSNLDPDKLVMYCEDFAKDYNIIDRFADIHETWFIKVARQVGRILGYKDELIYKGVQKIKREEMVTELDVAFARGDLYVLDYCKYLQQQILSYANKPDSEDFNPVKGDFHVMDSVIYGNRLLKTLSEDKQEEKYRDPIWKAIDKQFFQTKVKSKIFSNSL